MANNERNLSTASTPLSPGDFHPIFNQITTCAFNDARGDRAADHQILIVTQKFTVINQRTGATVAGLSVLVLNYGVWRDVWFQPLLANYCRAEFPLTALETRLLLHDDVAVTTPSQTCQHHPKSAGLDWGSLFSRGLQRFENARE